MKKFKDLSKIDQKLAIVKDAIKQIKIGKTIVTTGVYMEVVDNGEGSSLVDDKDNLKKLIKRPDFICQACAKGALFAACVLETNEVYGNNHYSLESFQSHKLKPWFKRGEIDLIEETFEGWGDKESASFKFYKKYKNPKTRLLAILNNILENKEFSPAK